MTIILISLVIFFVLRGFGDEADSQRRRDYLPPPARRCSAKKAGRRWPCPF